MQPLAEHEVGGNGTGGDLRVYNSSGILEWHGSQRKAGGHPCSPSVHATEQPKQALLWRAPEEQKRLLHLGFCSPMRLVLRHRGGLEMTPPAVARHGGGNANGDHQH
mmetsp:Transcript_21808/g.56106  ORF Transcript_21808/g.56106 Transcript_21808/m.56106 type:complete len:107 (+) Transcript_21808:802-1122(+)